MYLEIEELFGHSPAVAHAWQGAITFIFKYFLLFITSSSL